MALLIWIKDALLISLWELFYLVGILFLVGWLLGRLEKQSLVYRARAFGKKGVLLTAWLGTPIHELGHLIQCWIWRHRVKKIKLLQLNMDEGVLGYVSHEFNRKSFYQRIGNFFVGIGPILSGIGALVLLLYLLLPQSYHAFIDQVQQNRDATISGLAMFQILGEGVSTLGQNLFSLENLSKPTFWLFLYLGICISSHIALSRADIKNSMQGLTALYSFFVVVNLIASKIQGSSDQIVTWLAQYNAYFLAFSSIAVLLSVLAFLLSFLLARLRSIF